MAMNPAAALSELSDAAGGGQPGDVVPPKFTQLLKDIEGTAGELVRFDCRVIGHPTPVIKWYRGRNLIQTSADFKVGFVVENVDWHIATLLHCYINFFLNNYFLLFMDNSFSIRNYIVIVS